MRLLSLLISLALVSASWAGKKSPEEEAKAAKEFSDQLRGEVEFLTALFEESGTPMPPVVKRYIDLTQQEADLVAKSAEAWGSNQPRRAQLQRERAQTFCDRRGSMSEEVHSLAKKTKAEWMGQKEAGEPKDKEKSKTPPEKTFDKEPPGEKVPAKKDEEKPELEAKEESTKPPGDLSEVETRLREIEEKEAALAREKRQLIDQVRETAAE